MDSVGEELSDWLARMPQADREVEALRQRIGRVSRLFDRVLDRVAEDQRISRGDLTTLSVLARADRPCTPTELRHILGLTSGTVSTRLKRLAAAGLIELAEDADGRSRPVRLTAAGQDRWRDATAERVRREERLVGSALSAAELAGANAGLAALLAHLEAEFGRAPRHDEAP